MLCILMNTLFITESVIRDTDSTRKCLSDLIETLQMRMTAIKEAEASWEYLLPSTKNLTILEPIKLDNLILEAGTVQQIDMVTEEEEEILPPHQIQESLNKLDSNINDILSEWQGIVNTTVSEILKGNIIADDAFLDELQIDKMHVDFLNDEDVRPEDIIFPEDEEEFVNSLRAKRIVARNLEVDSLCGIPSQCKLNKINLLLIINYYCRFLHSCCFKFLCYFHLLHLQLIIIS